MNEYILRILQTELKYQSNMYGGLFDKKNKKACEERVTQLQQAIKTLSNSEVVDELKRQVEYYKGCLMFEPLRDWIDVYMESDDDFAFEMSEREKDFMKEFIKMLCEYVSEQTGGLEEEFITIDKE